MRATRGRHRSLCELGLVVLAAGDIGRAAACFGESLALCREVGDRAPVVPCLAGLAAAATSTDDSAIWAIQAARLLGSTAALVEALGDVVLTGTEWSSNGRRRGPRGAEAAARARLGDARFAAALAEGRSLPPDRAIDHGLDVANALLDIVSAAARVRIRADVSRGAPWRPAESLVDPRFRYVRRLRSVSATWTRWVTSTTSST